MCRLHVRRVSHILHFNMECITSACPCASHTFCRSRIRILSAEKSVSICWTWIRICTSNIWRPSWGTIIALRERITSGLRYEDPDMKHTCGANGVIGLFANAALLRNGHRIAV